MTTLDLAALVADPATRTIVCCGAGGVGKTTTAAALALHAAEHGRRTVVLTIDPARRLAQSMGLTELDNTPRRVTGVDESAGGSLDAMMLDMKRTFDEVVLAHASAEQARQILSNPFYETISGSFAGTQEYMAMEKLGQLRAQADRDGTWDLVVVDTPPSRTALDFLDAPQRLSNLLDGPFLRLLTRPARIGGRLSAKTLQVATGALSKVVGSGLLTDVSTFAAAMDTLFGGFRERADATYAQLTAPGTAFVVVTTPEADAVREAEFFVDRLERDGLPLAGVVVNKIVLPVTGSPGARELLAAADREDGEDRSSSVPAAVLLRLAASRAAVGARHRAVVERLRGTHPSVPVALVEAGAVDVHDAEGLRRLVG